MGGSLTCDGCGKAIEEFGFRAYPARVDSGQLVGTDEDGTPIGDGRDLCLDCVKVAHPGTEAKELELAAE
jgi:hypothetical protein